MFDIMITLMIEYDNGHYEDGIWPDNIIGMGKVHISYLMMNTKLRTRILP